MTLAQAPLLTNGADHSAQTFRMMIRDLARGSEGVSAGADLKVTALTVPGGAVQIGDGSGVVRGRSNAWQGHYSVYNIGTEQAAVSPTGASGRSDMVVCRVEDPDYEGTLNPATDPINYFQVIANVGSSATTVPAGYSAIPLARIDIPANTGTITQAMIKDLRRIVNPRRDRQLFTVFPGSLSTLTAQDSLWHDWPVASVIVPVPAWAVNCKIVTTIAGLRLSVADVYAAMQNVLGTIQGQDTAIDDDQGTGIRRNTVVVADSFTVTSGMRGTNQTLHMQTYMSRLESGDLGVDTGTSIIFDVEFTEGVI